MDYKRKKKSGFSSMPFLAGLAVGFIVLWTVMYFGTAGKSVANPEVLNAQIKEEKEKIQKLESELEALRQKKDELQALESGQSQEELEKQKEEIENELKQLSQSVQQNESKKVNLPSELQKLEFEKSLASQKIDAAKVVLSGLEEQVAFFETQKAALQNDIARSNGQTVETPPAPSQPEEPTSPRPQNNRFTISGDDVNMRNEPSRSGKSLALLSSGAAGTILKVGASETIGKWGEHNWYQVRMDDGTEGWVFGGCIERQ